MKCPDKCPACGGNFRFDFVGPENEYLNRYCDLKINHKIIIQTKHDSSNIIRLCITINLEKQIAVEFLPDSKYLKYGKTNHFLIGQYFSLPWFDPDLSDYAKLVDKLKTYVIMS